jgi:L-asparaginase
MQVNFLKSRQKIVVLGTGGTIAGRASRAGDNLGYVAGQVAVGEILQAIPVFADHAQVLSEQVAQVDSKDMDFATWTRLAKRVAFFLGQDDIAGVVITHGTDTLEETAFLLQALLNPAKPVVFTCAMRPSTALFPDGPQNLLDALAVARCERARGVVVVCAGAIHGALEVQKTHTYRLDAFASGDAGPLGYIEEGVVRLLRNWPDTPASWPSEMIENMAAKAESGAWPKVDIVMNYAGASGSVVDALVAQGIDGLVTAGTGNGTLHVGLEAALQRAQSAGVRIMRSTRCPMGRVLRQPGDTFEDSEGLSSVKARVALLLSLLAGKAA